MLEHRVVTERIIGLGIEVQRQTGPGLLEQGYAACPIGKWLKAGVLEGGTWTEGTAGTPQGAVIPPLLANVCLHCVCDPWVRQWRSRHARGDAIAIRYADDTIAGFRHGADARRFLDDLRARLAKFELGP